MKRKTRNSQVDEICRMWISEKMQKEMKPKRETVAKPIGDERIQQELEKGYQFRYNKLTGQVEYSMKKSQLENEPFQMLDKRVLFTLCLEMREKGINCWDKDVQRYLFSSRIAEYHPIQAYLVALPAWDGNPRVMPLIERITKEEICQKAMFRWLIAVTAQWMEGDGVHGNALAPLLISSIQGVGKSTYCKNLVPHALRSYYTDLTDIGNKGRMEQRLVQNCLINLDEFDRLPSHKMPLLKNLMQVSEVSLCKAYQSYFSSLPRVASFIATSNRTDLLTDPTGSRRFICIPIKEEIDNSPLCHKQLYAELKSYLEQGEPGWLTKEEEAALQKHNQTFYRESPQMERFRLYFSAGRAGQGNWIHLSEVIQTLNRGGVSDGMPPLTASLLGKELTAAGLEKQHKRDGNYYYLERVRE
ncbi:MAG: VapE domain-containing protein [Phocaeicola sp.]